MDKQCECEYTLDDIKETAEETVFDYNLRRKNPELGVFSRNGYELTKGTEKSACWDIRSSVDIVIPPGKSVLVSTGLFLDIPPNYSFRLHPRSGMALKGITLANAEGVVDQDYVDEVKIMLYNYGVESFSVAAGDRIAQGELVETIYGRVKVLNEPPAQKTDRAGGFGSTGVK